jgi:aconitate hydratase
VYLCSPEVAVVSALRGEITNPKKLGRYPAIKMPKKFLIDDSLIVPPPRNGEKVEIMRGPNIAPLPVRGPLENNLVGEVLIKLGDNITTDHIMPAGAQILPLRSNIPKISEFVFSRVDPEFVKRAKEKHGGFIVGGENYGQGSSREHAALAPMYLWIKAVFAKSFARIHRSNLVNFGIVPLLVTDASLFDALQMGSRVEMHDVRIHLQRGEAVMPVKVNGVEYTATHDLVERERKILLAGGLLNFTKAGGATS